MQRNFALQVDLILRTQKRTCGICYHSALVITTFGDCIIRSIECQLQCCQYSPLLQRIHDALLLNLRHVKTVELLE